MHHVKKLKNDLKYFFVPNRGTKAVTVLVLFPIGSRYENQKQSGASHFVEHLLFKGTKKRPTYLEISRELDAAGADYNAFTYKDYTGYYVKINSEQAELAFDLLADIAFNSILPEKEVKKEKGVIVEELRMYEDNPLMAVDLLFDKAMFGNYPLGWDIGGTVQTVRAMTRADLYNYYRRHYLPHNAILAVSGNLSDSKLQKLLKKFSVLPAGKGANVDYERFVWPKGLSLGERVQVKERKLDQVQVIMGFPGFCHTDKRIYATAVMLAILGGGMSSRLFVEVREKRGLAYMVRAGASAYRDVGTVQIQAGLDPARLPEAIKVIRAELKKMATKAVGKKELTDAKNNLIGRMALAMEDSATVAEKTAKQFCFLDKVENEEEVEKKIRRVTAGQVCQAAKDLFKESEMRLAVIGPVKKEHVLKML